MNCKKIEKYFWKYIDENSDGREDFLSLLNKCPEQKAKFEKINRLFASYRAIAKKTEVNPFLENKIWNKITSEETKTYKILNFINKIEFAIAILIISIAISMGILIGNSFTKIESQQTDFYAANDLYIIENDYIIEIFND